MLSFNTNGLERLDKLAQNLEDLSQKKFVSYDELFNSDFMNSNTQCSSFSDFLEAGGFKVESKEDFAAIPDAEFDLYVQQNTSFLNWAEMQEAATSSWIRIQVFNSL